MNSRRDRTQHINRQNQIINFRRTKNRQTPKFIYLPLCVPCALLGIVCRAVWLSLFCANALCCAAYGGAQTEGAFGQIACSAEYPNNDHAFIECNRNTIKMKFYTQPEKKKFVDARIGQARATVSTRTRETITAHTDKKNWESHTQTI